MNWKKLFLCTGLILYFLVSFAQLKIKDVKPGKDTIIVNTLLSQSRENFGTDPDKAIALSVQAKELSEKIHFNKGIALALKNIGIGNYYQGKNVEALGFYQQSLQVFQVN